MGVAFLTSNSKMPGLNWETQPGPRDLEFVFDTVFAGEQRNRLQLGMGYYRAGGAAYGIVDELNPNTATENSNRPLSVQPNVSDPLTLDILPGIAVTKAGNIIVVTDNVVGVSLANDALTTNAVSTEVVDPQFQGIENVVLLEYSVVGVADTETVTPFNTTEAVRRDVAPDIDPEAEATSLEDPDLNKPQIVKVVTIQDFLDTSKFSDERLNDVVVLAIVKVVSNSSPPPTTILNIDMANSVNTYVRPWFSLVDQEHRSLIGTGSPDVPHALGFNDLSGGTLTLYQQMLQVGAIVSRDTDVPGCPGKLCTELVDSARIRTDTDGSITGTASRKYVNLNSYPVRILGARENTLDGSDIVEDKTLSARPVSVELIPHTNVLMLHRQDTTDETIDSTKGFTVYYTDSDCLRPPALPQEIMLVANDIIQFQSPTEKEIYITGGKVYNELSTTQYTVGTNGPIPKNYHLYMDETQQFVEAPQIVSCAKLINDSTGVGTATQTPQFPMYGPAKIRAALYNATPQPNTTLEVQVELTGKDADGAVVTEILIFHGTAGSAQPQQVAWDQAVSLPASGEYSTVFQVSDTIFSSLDSWKIRQTPVAVGANALIQLWAEIEPTVTPALDDALSICRFNWNGQSVAKIWDARPTFKTLKDAASTTESLGGVNANAALNLVIYKLVGLGGAESSYLLFSENFKEPKYQDNILSKRFRHNAMLDTVYPNETLEAFNSDGTNPGREWYYSQAFPLGSNTDKIYLYLFNQGLDSLASAFGGDAIVQYQKYSDTITAGSWTTMSQVGSQFIRKLENLAGTAFKIRFRIAGKQLTGFNILAVY